MVQKSGMSTIAIVEKLVGVATIGGALANVALLQRFLTGIAHVVALSVISGLMVCLLLLGSFFGLYFGLTHYGLGSTVAALMIGAFAFLITSGIIGLTVLKLRQLQELPVHATHAPMPVLAHLSSLAAAFIEGLLEQPARRK
jgi:hypothetical protein